MSVYAHSTGKWSDEELQASIEAYFDMIGIMVDQAEQSGMNFWLYDEGGWPSGGACGQVYDADPEKFCIKTLIYDEETKEAVVHKGCTAGNLGYGARNYYKVAHYV